MIRGTRTGLIVGLALVVLGEGLSVARADTLYVNGATGSDAWDGRCETWDGGTCGPKATIQAGINAAVAGDEVVIANGTYTGTGNKNLDFNGKAITVRSASGDPALCVIDCESAGRGFYFHSGEEPDSVVEGLTIRNGSTGGVYCSSSSPTLTNCTISGNSVYRYGGGIRCSHSSPTLTNCTISGNSADDGTGGGDGFEVDGGGVYCHQSSPTLTNCTISGNWARYGGGGVGCAPGSDPTLTNCTISGNSANDPSDGCGGGVFCLTSNATLTNCTISGNSAHGDGEYSAGYGGGGGVFCYNSFPTLTNCTLSGNVADYYGGGLCCLDSSPTLTDCTLSGNSASDGGGVSCLINSVPRLTNCILWGDAPQEVYVSSMFAILEFCCIQGGWAGTANIAVDPMFVDSDGPDDDPNTWADNNYRLSPGSPCIDVGNNAAVPADLLFDLDGQPRITDGDDDGVAIVDMGAYERPATIIGDLNCDGVVNFGDINPFVDVLMDRVQYAAKYPGCDYRFADCSGDGAVDFADINPFIDLLLGR